MNNTAENDILGLPKVKWLQYKVRWANVQAFDVKFSQDLTQQKSLELVNFRESYLKNKKVDVFWGHSVCSSPTKMISFIHHTVKRLQQMTVISKLQGKPHAVSATGVTHHLVIIVIQQECQGPKQKLRAG